MKFEKKARQGKFRRGNAALSMANPWFLAVDFAKRAESCSAATKERKRFWWQASVLGRTLNSEGRIEGDSKTTKSANKRAISRLAVEGKRKFLRWLAAKRRMDSFDEWMSGCRSLWL